mgnify:CR=1 FL=1
MHINQSIDQNIDVLRNEVFDKKNKAAISIIGKYGAGKTHRLLYMKKQCEKNDVFNVYVEITNETRFLLAGLIDGILEKADLDGFSKFLKPPIWYKEIKGLKKHVKNNYDPIRAGQIIVKALNANAPAVILLNDLHNLKQSIDLDNFVRVLKEIIDHSEPGILVMVSCRLNFYKKFFKKYKGLHERINENIVIPEFKNDEASLLLAKRMLERRMVDNLESLYPFTEETVKVLNERANGNPRNILKLSSFILDQATNSRIMTINEEFTCEQLNSSKNRSLDEAFEEKIEEKTPKTEIKTMSIAQKNKDKYDDPLIKRIGGIKHPVNNSNQDITNCNSGLVTKMNNEKNIVNQNKNSFENNGSKNIKVKCPKCTRTFVFEVREEKEKMKCPNPKCDFVGIINKKNL